MKLDLLQKQTSRREILRGSATLAGSIFLAPLFNGIINSEQWVQIVYLTL